VHKNININIALKIFSKYFIWENFY